MTRIHKTRTALARRRILITVLTFAQIRNKPITIDQADDIASVILHLMPKMLARRLAKSNDDKTAYHHVLKRVSALMA